MMSAHSLNVVLATFQRADAVGTGWISKDRLADILRRITPDAVHLHALIDELIDRVCDGDAESVRYEDVVRFIYESDGMPPMAIGPSPEVLCRGELGPARAPAAGLRAIDASDYLTTSDY